MMIVEEALTDPPLIVGTQAELRHAYVTFGANTLMPARQPLSKQVLSYATAELKLWVVRV
jgi:hypothetical protein